MIKLYSLQGDLQGSKILLVGTFLGVQIDRINFTEKDLTSAEFLKKSPFGTVPLIDTESGSITETNAILRYVARQAEAKGLYAYGKNVFEASKIDAWLDWELTNLSPLVKALKSSPEESNKKLEHYLKVLDNHLLHNSFLGGDSLSIADFSIISTLFATGTNPQKDTVKKAFPSVARWAKFITSQEQWKVVAEESAGEGVSMVEAK